MRVDRMILPRRIGRGILPAAVTGILLLGGGNARADACATGYRAALDTVRDRKAEALAGLLRSMRAGDAQLSGRWLFSAMLFEKAKKARTERVCVETAEGRRGKTFCTRHETRTIPPPDEIKDLKALAQFVEGKGAVPELGVNGRYGFLFQRVAQDLRLYLQQEPHPGLCAGAPDLVDFYDGQLVPLKKRLTDASDLARRTRAAADSRVAAIFKAETTAYAKALGAAKAAADTAEPKAAADPVAPVPGLPIGPDAAPADIGTQSFAGLAGLALRPLVGAEKRATIAAAAPSIQALTEARALFIAAQAEGNRGVDPTVREAAGQALRAIEAAAYADLLKRRYADVEAIMFSTPGEIRDAHKAKCTCAD